MTTAAAVPSSPKTKSRKTTTGGIGLKGETLHRVIRDLEPAVSMRSPRPALQHILIRDGMAIATDLELRIESPLPEAIGAPMLLPFDRLRAIAGTIGSDENVRLRLDGESCVVFASRGEWRIPTGNPADFPDAAQDAGKPIGRLPADQLSSLLKAVQFATDQNSSRYALGAVCIEFARGGAEDADGTITFVGTDGRRMAIAEAKVGSQDLDNSRTLLPLRAAVALARLAKSAEAVQMFASHREFVAVIGEHDGGGDIQGVTLRAQLSEGHFPKWQEVDKRHNVQASKVVVGDFLHAIRMARICTSETSKGVAMEVSGSGLSITSRAAETGEASIDCPVEEIGQTFTIRIDPRFASDWLSCGSFDKAEVVSVEAVGAEDSLVLRLDNYRTVIMPLAAD